ncbi:hypothetical protein GGQ57_003085 [Parabacteroides faecis]|uniref:Uncharacterized protein n=1 Tax=Parabacteroides faecis TaxID=1217282 RepID=A0ABR6KQW5_9BACT|nr:hypothetical protein [Parabacteroides faecis]
MNEKNYVIHVIKHPDFYALDVEMSFCYFSFRIFAS